MLNIIHTIHIYTHIRYMICYIRYHIYVIHYISIHTIDDICIYVYIHDIVYHAKAMSLSDSLSRMVRKYSHEFQKQSQSEKFQANNIKAASNRLMVGAREVF